MRTRVRAVFIVCCAASSGLVWGADPDRNSVKARIVDIEWPDRPIISVSNQVMDRFPGIEKTLLPVLVPKPFLTYPSLIFVGEPLHYSVSVKDKGATYAITGTRIAIDEDGSYPPASDRIRTALGELSVEAAVKRFGAAYLVTVECKSPEDSRCMSDSLAADLLQSADIVGGGRSGTASLPPAPASPITIAVKADPNFTFKDPGDLLDRSGTGVRSSTVYAPAIRFPVSAKPAYLNSQVWNFGGEKGTPSRHSWGDPRNYAYPWRDNFCETRGYRTPLCPSGNGHQGVDIRPSDARNSMRQMAVAVEPGRISKIGPYSVTLAGDSGSYYIYLHLRELQIAPGQRVATGQAIGLISNKFKGTPTSRHLHFEIKQNVNGRGLVHVPPYSSLVAAYRRM